ncbi:chemotaxis protein CheW [Methanococcus voltae]|uniref:Chemotaxis protein CheA n=1 Tax=Methanococcus voltae (strain ATCC BAA-1334 / A3) TaxID=456320 RepID=D7DTZ6_METV3|nr:chemotaxis protein CheA [Methanococcus voltae]MCS3900406.1 two-component system chemotaxis sensor kinase CheA [Methanococcus voltae]
MDEMEQYRELFMTEAEEHLQSLNQNLVDLENCPEDTEIINLIFRSAHTLKGSARTLGFEHISQLTHHMEDILDNIRDGKIPVNHEIMDLLFKCLDALETMVGEVADGENETSVDYESIIDIIKNLKDKHLGNQVGNSGNSAKVSETSPAPKKAENNVNSADAVVSSVSGETKCNPASSVSNKQSYSLKNEKTLVKIELKKDAEVDVSCEENEVSELDIDKIQDNENTENNENTEKEAEIKKLNIPENIDEILGQMHQSSNTLCAISGALELSELQNSTKQISRFTKSVLDKKIDMDKEVLQMINKSLSVMNSIAKSIENREEVQKYANDEVINNLDNFVAQKIESKNSIAENIDNNIDNIDENNKNGNGKIINFEEIEVEYDHTIFNYLENLNKIANELNDNSSLWHIKSEIEEDCMLKSVRFTMLLNSLENDSKGTIIESIPTIEDIKNVSYDNIDVLYAYSGTEGELEDILNSACEMNYSKAVKVDIEVNINEMDNTTELTEPINCDLEDKEISCDYKIRFSIDQECALKSVRAYMVLKDLSEMGTIVDSCPSYERIQAGDSVINQVEVYYNSRADIDTVEDTIIKTPEIKNIDVATHKKDMNNNESNNSESESDENSNSEKSERKESQSKKSESKKSQTVRVNIEKLDKLMNLVGEVVINRANFTQIATKYDLKELHNAVGRLNMLSTELQEEVMSMRMIPVAFVFNRFPRTVRDTARALNKEIDFIIEGSEIELDRTVLDELAEPLTHLIRNSLDHGIEHADVRKQLGKPEKGLLKLIATRERDRVNIVIKDDGKGINPETIRNNVVKKGLMSREEVEKLTDNEAINLIFLPGFSTAEKVSDVSGRGVGMDVVRTKIESLGGSVSVQSEVGKGSEIILHLPLTMAIIQTLLVKLKDQIYALPLTSVLDVVSISNDEINNLEGQEAIIYRDHILPVTWLCDALHQYNDCSSEEIYVVVVEKNKGKIGLILDEVIGRDEIVVKPLTGILKNINGLAGATILGDGRVALILDLNNL